jgi:hypothetical protein
MQDLQESSSDLESKAVLAAPRRRIRRRCKHAPRPRGRSLAKVTMLGDIGDEHPHVYLAFHKEVFFGSRGVGCICMCMVIICWR